MKKVLTRNVTTIIGAVGFKVPTEAEWTAEIATWDTQDDVGAFGSVLKLTLSGGRFAESGVIEFEGSNTAYWSSSVDNILSFVLSIFGGSIFFALSERGLGFPVRLIKQGTFESHTPETITIKGLEYQTVYNPTTQRIWLDRNLGATKVAESLTDSDAYGWLYQWGRGTDGHQIRTSGTTGILSSTDQPGHGDFILAPDAPNDWRSPQNDNLWQGTEGINNPATTTTTVKKILTRNGKILVRVLQEPEFIILVNTSLAGSSSDTMQLPIRGTDMTIDWGDGSTSTHTQTATPASDNWITKVYDIPGQYEIKVTGLDWIYFNNQGDKAKLVEISNWGTTQWISMQNSFFGCNNMTGTFTDAPDLSNVTNMGAMFRAASDFNHDISQWNTANIEDMGGMFLNATAFNQDLSDWCVPLIPLLPNFFDAGATAWILPNSRPIWGTCP